MSKKDAHHPHKTNTSALSGLKHPRLFGLAGVVIVAGVLLFMAPKAGAMINKAKPGDIAFPLDRLMENVTKLLTSDPTQQARLALQRANERQNEAESMVFEFTQINCQKNQNSQLSDPDLVNNLTTGFNLFLADINEAEAKANLLSKGSQEYEDIMAGIVVTNIHHLLLWESISQFVPVEVSGVLTKTAELMSQSTQRALANLPEGRKQDIAAKAQVNTQSIIGRISTVLAQCRGTSSGSGEETTNGVGTTGSSSTGTTNTTNTGNTGAAARTNTNSANRDSVSSTTRTIIQQIEGTPTPQSPQPTNRPNQPLPTLPPLVPTLFPDGIDLSVGSNELSRDAQFNDIIDLNTYDGDGIDVNLVPETHEENTTGCNGVKVLGICVGN